MMYFYMSTWMGETPIGTHEFDAPTVEHAIGYCRGLMTDRLERQGEACLALGTYERLDKSPRKTLAKGEVLFTDETHLGDWRYARQGVEIVLVWKAAANGDSEPRSG